MTEESDKAILIEDVEKILKFHFDIEINSAQVQHQRDTEETLVVLFDLLKQKLKLLEKK